MVQIHDQTLSLCRLAFIRRLVALSYMALFASLCTSVSYLFLSFLLITVKQLSWSLVSDKEAVRTEV